MKRVPANTTGNLSVSVFTKEPSLAAQADTAVPAPRFGRAHRARRVGNRPHGTFGLSVSPLAIISLAGLATYLAKDWIAGLGLILLWIVWRVLYEDGKPPVLPMALTFQWFQVTIGIYYYALTGRQVEAMWASDYRPMVLMGLGCITTILLGLAAGLKIAQAKLRTSAPGTNFAFSWRGLFIGYVASIFLNGFLAEVAWQIPLFTQGILAVSYLRLGLLYLIFRRLSQPAMRWNWFLGIIGVELVLGFSGFFASFREPLVLAALALIECFDRRSATHWLRLGGLAGAMLVLGVLWMGIRTSYRREFSQETFARSRSERLETVGTLSSEWFESDFEAMITDADRLVERLWAIYYPAIAVSRVPEVLPHENGAIMWSALKHIVTPRALFPDKGVLPSDSDLVRKYTSIPVAGADQNTSIAFGYAAESYIDFGIPMMFVPTLVFGLVLGSLYRASYHVMHHRELSVAFVSVVFWLSLYLFERSWIKTFGLTLTLVIYLGTVVWILDRHFRRKVAERSRRPVRSIGQLERGRIGSGASSPRL
jgi:hypothetical protein